MRFVISKPQIHSLLYYSRLFTFYELILSTCSSEHGGVTWLLALIVFWLGKIMSYDHLPLYMVRNTTSLTEARLRFGGSALAAFFTFCGACSVCNFAIAGHYKNEKDGTKVFLNLILLGMVGYDSKLVCVDQWRLVKNIDNFNNSSENGNGVNPNELSDVSTIIEKGQGNEREHTGLGLDGKKFAKRGYLSKLGAFLLALLTTTTGLGNIIFASNANKFSPSGEFFDIGTNQEGMVGRLKHRRMHIHCEGPVTDAPIIMYEHGLKGSSLDFR